MLAPLGLENKGSHVGKESLLAAAEPISSEGDLSTHHFSRKKKKLFTASIWLTTFSKLLGFFGDAYYIALLYDLAVHPSLPEESTSKEAWIVGSAFSAYTTGCAAYCNYKSSMFTLKKSQGGPEQVIILNQKLTCLQYTVLAGYWLDRVGGNASHLGIASHFVMPDDTKAMLRIPVQLGVFCLAVLASYFDGDNAQKTIQRGLRMK